jgi:hypothetical protein
MRKSKLILLFLGAVIVTGFIFQLFYNSTHVLGGLKLETAPEDIKEKAVIFSNEENLKTGDANIDAGISSDYQLIQYIQQKYGIQKGNEYLRDSLPGYYWAVAWTPKGVSGITIGSSDNKNKILEQYLKDITLHYDSKGNLIRFSVKIADTVSWSSVTRNEAKIIAERFLSKYTEIKDIVLSDKIGRASCRERV